MSVSIGARLKAWRTGAGDQPRHVAAIVSDSERMHAALREYGEALRAEEDAAYGSFREEDNAAERVVAAEQALLDLALEIAESEEDKNGE